MFSRQVCWFGLASHFLVLTYLTIVEVANVATCGLGVQQKNEIASLEVNLNLTEIRRIWCMVFDTDRRDWLI